MKITDVTDITDFHMVAVHVSKHSLFFVSRSRSIVDCARVQAFTFLLTKTLSISRSVVWCVVFCVCACGVCSVCVGCVCTCGVVCGVGGTDHSEHGVSVQARV